MFTVDFINNTSLIIIKMLQISTRSVTGLEVCIWQLQVGLEIHDQFLESAGQNSSTDVYCLCT